MGFLHRTTAMDWDPNSEPQTTGGVLQPLRNRPAAPCAVDDGADDLSRGQRSPLGQVFPDAGGAGFRF